MQRSSTFCRFLLLRHLLEQPGHLLPLCLLLLPDRGTCGAHAATQRPARVRPGNWLPDALAKGTDQRHLNMPILTFRQMSVHSDVSKLVKLGHFYLLDAILRWPIPGASSRPGKDHFETQILPYVIDTVWTTTAEALQLTAVCLALPSLAVFPSDLDFLSLKRLRQQYRHYYT